MKNFPTNKYRTAFTGFWVLILTLFGAMPASALDKGVTPLGVPGVKGGVVTTSEPLAAQAGADILRQGGNAIDAAAAVQFALNVVEPQSSGIGGGAFMMIHLAKEGKTFIIDSRETAPAGATANMFLDTSFPVRSTSGYAVGVPGTLLGMATALKNWGTISLADALQPATDLAENGIRVSSRLAESITSARLDNEPGNPAYEVARNIFRPGGIPLQEGELLVQQELANTFKMIAKNGSGSFYSSYGGLATAIVATQMATRSSNPTGWGRMTTDDLAGYKVAIRQPVEGQYRGYRIVSMPPPSSGGLTVIQIVKLLEGFPIGDKSQGFGFGQSLAMHTFIEASRLAFADRSVWMGDTDFVDLPVKGLIDDDYVAMRSTLIDLTTAAIDVQADDPRPYEDDCKKKSKCKDNGDPKLAPLRLPDVEGRNTTHFSIVDSKGNIVTCTSTIESAWGTGLMVPGYGFMLNNELTDFNSAPTYSPDPDNFNPGANDLKPGKRPRSSMAPTMIFDKKQPLAAFGSPGGSSIISTVAQFVINLIDHEKTVQESVDAPRLRQTVANGTTQRELGFSDAVLAELEEMGHTVSATTEVLGSVQAVVLDKDKQYGAADKRRIGGVISIKKEAILAK